MIQGDLSVDFGDEMNEISPISKGFLWENQIQVNGAQSPKSSTSFETETMLNEFDFLIPTGDSLTTPSKDYFSFNGSNLSFQELFDPTQDFPSFGEQKHSKVNIGFFESQQ